MVIRWTRSSRRHRIGRARALHVIRTNAGDLTTARGGDAAITWLGQDDRGLELEVLALVDGEDLVVIHVMPTALRRS